ncbi:MAG: hypothetical protein ABII68_00665 [Pseudomonadota bacterium]
MEKVLQRIARESLRGEVLPVEKVIELILASSGENTREKPDRLVAVFPESEVEKAVRVFFEITDELEYTATLVGGNTLIVYTNE